MTRLDRLREFCVSPHRYLAPDELLELCDHAQALADALARWAGDAIPPELRAFDEWNNR